MVQTSYRSLWRRVVRVATKGGGRYRARVLLHDAGPENMLHCFVKKSQKNPLHERRIAEKRMKEIKQ